MTKAPTSASNCTLVGSPTRSRLRITTQSGVRNHRRGTHSPNFPHRAVHPRSTSASNNRAIKVAHPAPSNPIAGTPHFP